MAKLYEKFVLNFYKKHLPPQQYKVHSPIFTWGLDDKFNHIGLEYLPQMKSDIVIVDKVNNGELIIDTKFYVKTLIKSNHGEVKKLISNNLYQIFAYINNISYPGAITGMLLYPTTEGVES